ncbi:hypothetical protein ACS0TY_028402 [Phlomoides rotata]
MKFGREFRIHLEKTLPEWRGKYLCYKLLKKLLNSIIAPVDSLPPAPAPRLPLPELQVWFVAILTEEVKKFNYFYVGKEEDLIIRFQALKEMIERVNSEIELNKDMTEICKDLVAIHGEMILLKSYSSLNFAGLIKILKKYDKRTGAMLSLPFIQLAFHQPFFTTEPLTRLIHECEENLEFLFPLDAEVVESGDELTGTAHADLETTLSLVEETVGIFQSTIATLTAIDSIKGASSSVNPLSMSNLFGRQRDDSTGSVTAGNSPCNDLEDENEDVCLPD